MTITKDTTVSFPVNHKGRYWLWNESSAWDQDVNNVVDVPRTRTGTRMPKWREVIEQGENATTPMTAELCSLDYTNLHGTYEERMYQNNPVWFGRRENEGATLIRNNQNSILPFNTSLWSGVGDQSFVDNLARAAFYKKLKQMETLFQGYTFAGELGESLRMLRNPLVGLRGLAKDFLGTLGKRKRANPKKWLNDAGSAWLEQSFGWNPLIADVKSAYDAYQRLIKPVQTMKISASSSKTYDGTRSKGQIYWPGAVLEYDSGCYFHTVSSWFLENIKVRYKGAIVAQVKGPSWQNKDLFGFEPQNFIPTAWELLPWSFLADYFTNIGDILDASIVSTRHLAWVNKTVITTRVKHGLFKQVWSPDPSNGLWQKVAMSSSLGKHFAKRRLVDRTANSGMSMPTLQFNFDLTGGQLANIDALLTQASALHPQHNPRNWHR